MNLGTERLRDQFAMAALSRSGVVPGSHNRPDNAAREAYEIADAMLAARSTPQPDPVRDELVEALETCRHMAVAWMTSRDALSPAEAQANIANIDAALSKAKEGTS